MSPETIEIRCAGHSTMRWPIAALLPLAVASAMWFGAFALRTRSFGAALLVSGSGLVLGAAIYGYSRWVCSSSVLRWDGDELVVHEGFGRWRVRRQNGLTTRTARVRVGGQHSTLYLWVLDKASSPKLRIKVELWPRDELQMVLNKLGAPTADLADLQETTTARRMRRDNKRLLPFWMGHQSEITIVGAIAIVTLLVALL